MRLSRTFKDATVSIILIALLGTSLHGCGAPGTSSDDVSHEAPEELVTEETESKEQSEEEQSDTGSEEPAPESKPDSGATTVYYEEPTPSLDALPEGVSVDKIESAVKDYLNEHYPSRAALGQELIGEVTNGDSDMWASYVVRFPADKNVGLEVTYVNGGEVQVTEQRYLKAANGLFYDVETQQYVTDLEVSGISPSGVRPEGALVSVPDSATQSDPVMSGDHIDSATGYPITNPNATQPIRVRGDDGKEYSVRLND